MSGRSAAAGRLLPAAVVVAVALSPESQQLNVGRPGEVNVAGDSLPCFGNPEDGKLIQSRKPGSGDIAGLAYSPRTGQLDDVDFSRFEQAKRGGLFPPGVTADRGPPG